jgi:hypothetical protein
MGLFDYFSKESANARKREGALKKLTNMYYQQADRMASADVAYTLAAEGDDDAIRVLLTRFEHVCPSHTVDGEEKEYVVNLLVSLGEKCVEPVTQYCHRTSKPIYWPLKALEKLWSRDTLAEFLAELLEATDNDYARDPEKKIGLVQFAGQYDHDRVSRALVPFVDDHAEEVRYCAVDALLGRDFDAREALAERLAGAEESLRVRQRLARGFVDKAWPLGDHAEAIAGNLPSGYAVKGDRVVAA